MTTEEKVKELLKKYNLPMSEVIRDFLIKDIIKLVEEEKGK